MAAASYEAVAIFFLLLKKIKKYIPE